MRGSCPHHGQVLLPRAPAPCLDGESLPELPALILASLFSLPCPHRSYRSRCCCWTALPPLMAERSSWRPVPCLYAACAQPGAARRVPLPSPHRSSSALRRRSAIRDGRRPVRAPALEGQADLTCQGLSCNQAPSLACSASAGPALVGASHSRPAAGDGRRPDVPCPNPA